MWNRKKEINVGNNDPPVPAFTKQNSGTSIGSVKPIVSMGQGPVSPIYSTNQQITSGPIHNNNLSPQRS